MKYYYKNSKTMARTDTNRGMIVMLLLGLALIVVGAVYISAGYTLHNEYLEQKKIVDSLDNMLVSLNASKSGIILHDDSHFSTFVGVVAAIIGVIMSAVAVLKIVEGPFTLYEPNDRDSSGSNSNRYDDVKDNSVNIYTGMN
ncbi:MAG TPA: hypothetical protein DCX21_07040 [Eubacterium sp.]|nr:hypothetical protein [Eubacterium sp.]